MNPIVVFVVPWTIKTPDDAFPIGWPIPEGQRQLNIGNDQRASYSIIFLNDKLRVPPLKFFNKNSDQVLHVVRHINSDMHTSLSIPTNDVLNEWGKPLVCAKYHAKEELGAFPIWDAVELLFREGMSALDFAKTCRAYHNLRAYEDLAVLCQIKMLDPAYVGPNGSTDAWKEAWNKALKELPDDLGDALSNLENIDRLKKLSKLAKLLS